MYIYIYINKKLTYSRVFYRFRETLRIRLGCNNEFYLIYKINYISMMILERRQMLERINLVST